MLGLFKVLTLDFPRWTLHIQLQEIHVFNFVVERVDQCLQIPALATDWPDWNTLLIQFFGIPEKIDMFLHGLLANIIHYILLLKMIIMSHGRLTS